MKELLKDILKAVNLYHPLQLTYRQLLFNGKKLYLRSRYRQFKGGELTCNICGSHYSRFAPDYPSSFNRPAIERHAVIAGFGENIICPWCLSVARERLVIAMLEQMDLQQKNILQLSPEKNIFRYLSATARVETADLLPGFYKNVDVNIRQADATKLPYKENSFDMVIANHVLEHIPLDRQAMNEIYRVLKTPGLAVLQVPYSTKLSKTQEDPAIADPEKQSLLFGQKDHVRIYALPDYISRLREAGFNVEYLSYESLHPFYQFAIQKGEGFFKITK